MKCESCGKTTGINWGDAYTTLCEVCSDSDAGRQFIEENKSIKSSVSKDRSAESDSTANSIFSFEGRIKRSSFWMVIVPLFLISFGLQIGIAVSTDRGGSDGVAVLFLIYFIPAIWVALATYVKRWHDLNMSGWMVLTMFIPFVNLLILLYLGIAPGTAGANKYGDEP